LALVFGELLRVVGAVEQFAVGQGTIWVYDAQANGNRRRLRNVRVGKGSQLGAQLVQEVKRQRPGEAGDEEQVLIPTLAVRVPVVKGVGFDWLGPILWSRRCESRINRYGWLLGPA